MGDLAINSANAPEAQDGSRVDYQIGNKDYGSSAALRSDPPAENFQLPSDLKATDNSDEGLAGRP